MLNSVFDIFSGTLPVSKGFNEGVDSEGVNEVPEEKEEIEETEEREIRNSEGVEYSETDIERIKTAADALEEVFTDEVISNWENLSVEERASYLNEYYTKAGQALGIDTKGVYVEDLYEKYGYGVQGVNSGDGYLGIDVRLVADPSELEELMNTVTHEMRHQFQNDALENPDAYPDIPTETLEQWEYEMTHYVDPSYDFEGYESQAIETDARAFAEEVVEDYLSGAGNDTYSAAEYEAEIPADAVSDGEQAADSVELMSTPEVSEPDGVGTVEKASDGLESKPEAGLEKGFDVDQDLNKASFSYTPGQCARISTGTQNYCPFCGSGR